MKIALVGDLHIGARGSNVHVRNFIKSYMLEYLFPKFKELGINTYIQAGDAFDTRKSINAFDMDFIMNEFIPAHEEFEIEGHYIPGNHDVALRESNRISWVNVLSKLSNGMIISYNEAGTVSIGGEKFCMIPWINKENYESTLKVIDASDAKFAIAHLELAGFAMYKNSIAEEGQIELQTLSKFTKVVTGHFHTSSEEGNIKYVGSPYHLTWQDFPDGVNRGFYTFDTETKAIEFFPNPEHLTLFKVFVYDWRKCESDTEYKLKIKEPKYLEEDYGLKGSVVKVIVVNRDDHKHYSDFCAALRQCNVIDYTVVDRIETVYEGGVDGSSLASEGDAALISEEALQTDIIQVLKQRIIDTDLPINKVLAKEIISDIHTRALNSGDL